MIIPLYPPAALLFKCQNAIQMYRSIPCRYRAVCTLLHHNKNLILSRVLTRYCFSKFIIVYYDPIWYLSSSVRKLYQKFWFLMVRSLSYVNASSQSVLLKSVRKLKNMYYNFDSMIVDAHMLKRDYVHTSHPPRKSIDEVQAAERCNAEQASRAV